MRKIRQSQTLVPFGVGAIFDIRGESFVACDIWRWAGRGYQVRSERLCRALKIQELKAAPVVGTSRWAPPSAGIPYHRFPTWLFCQNCHNMVRWRLSLEQDGKVPTCPTCEGKRQLVPMRWIIICEHGHMDDVNWPKWAHSGGKSDASEGRCEQERLVFETVPSLGAGGLETLRVRCRTCNRGRNLVGITGKDATTAIGSCAGRQPWQRWEDRAECDAIPRVVQRGASNVYFPTVHSSIEIPNTSRADADSEKALEIKNDKWYSGLLTTNPESPMARMAVETLAAAYDVTEDFVRALVADDKAKEQGLGTVVTANPGDLLGEEWAAFVTPQTQDSDDFKTRHVGLGDGSEAPHDALSGRIDKVVVADRLREVRALEGFHRVIPAKPANFVRADLGRHLKWLPAVEVLGEGVFISLEESRLSAWEETDAVVDRVELLDRRIDESFMAARFREKTGPRLTPRYLLLHTLAHQLIRRLAFESGYSAASLRERVYARSNADDGPRQAGVLIYTAAGDAEGTLGGLVRQGEPPRLTRTLLEALQDATWCSADPLCRENTAAGLNGLNLAACHACSLVSETSCEAGNFLLDRVVLVGSEQVPGFFEPVVRAALEAAGRAVSEES
ncbi:DUF1998 domain-containing protein [Actinoplanes sp. KI2]|uniref:DUF1998 domain-containing protein n=1 Tax=Actinoplanes sp. KI2 TaxID=2983315 RepID=UPI0021D6073B|nr:DUF1998 domain-containing protein [Actinoplanes sp. KI2]MCU7730917.1 DUF1998 domain-containing protein [Actinoplanes sp. KI2]